MPYQKVTIVVLQRRPGVPAAAPLGPLLGKAQDTHGYLRKGSACVLLVQTEDDIAGCSQRFLMGALMLLLPALEWRTLAGLRQAVVACWGAPFQHNTHDTLPRSRILEHTKPWSGGEDNRLLGVRLRLRASRVAKDCYQ